MPDKLPSEILKITLDDATFKGTNAVVDQLTYVNFFFGNNGTGKSTIAKAIQSGAGVTYATGRTHADYLPLVYNQAFIDANVRSYHSLDGVFTINEVNVKIQEQIDEKATLQEAARKASTDASTERGKRSLRKKACSSSCIRTVGTRRSRSVLSSKKPKRARKRHVSLPKKSEDTSRLNMIWINSG